VTLPSSTNLLLSHFIPPHRSHLHPDHEHIGIWTTVIGLTLGNYYLWFGHRHRNRRKALESEQKRLKDELQKVDDKNLRRRNPFIRDEYF
jgi:hypothetical protein